MEFTKASLDEVEMVMEVVNTAYRVEIGSEGIAFKSNDRWGGRPNVIQKHNKHKSESQKIF